MFSEGIRNLLQTYAKAINKRIIQQDHCFIKIQRQNAYLKEASFTHKYVFITIIRTYERKVGQNNGRWGLLFF